MEADMINSPEELVYAVQDTLTYWKDIHTDADTWAVEWSNGGDYADLLVNSPEIGNGYFTFDLLTACQVMVAEDWMLVRCTQCGSLRSSYDECGSGDEDCYDADVEDLSTSDIEDYIHEVGGCEAGAVPEWIIERVMVEQAFPAYYAGVEHAIAGVVDEIETTQKTFEECTTNLELLLTAQHALGIMHVNGNIAKDYGARYSLDWDDVDTLRTEGLSGLFTEEEIEDYITEA